MSGNRQKYNNKNKRDEDFVSKSGMKRAPKDVTTVTTRKLSKLQEQEIIIFDKCVADLFSLSQEELDQATQVVEKLTNINLFFAKHTPLQIAAIRGDLEAVNKSITAGARVDDCNGCGQTALFLATEAGHVAVVRKLLERNANPDTINYREGQPIGSSYDLVSNKLTTPNHREIMAMFIEHQLPGFNAFDGLRMPIVGNGYYKL